MCYTATAKTHTGKRGELWWSELFLDWLSWGWFAWVGKLVDVPGVHGGLFLLSCLVVLHVFMAIFYPHADVLSRVLHDVFSCCVGDKQLEEGIFGGFMEYLLYRGLELGSVCLCEYWRVQMVIACGPQLYYDLPAKLYDFCKELIAIGLWTCWQR